MPRSDKSRETEERRFKMIQLLRANSETTNTQLQEIYGDKLFSTQHMANLRRAVALKVGHPERYSDKGLKKKLQELEGGSRAESLRKKHVAKHGTLRALPSAVDKLAGLKSFLDETVLPGMLGFTMGSDVTCVLISVTTDNAGNPTLTRKIGRTVTEWDEHTLDTGSDAEHG